MIRNLAAPKKPTNLSFKEIIGLVRDHYCPPPSEIVQRFMFNTRSQKEAETITDFVADLRRISEHCKFGDTLDQMLRDRLVCGIRDGCIQKRLLAEPELTFRKAFDLCQANEMAEKNAHNLRQASQKVSPAPIMSLKAPSNKNRSSTSVCYCCNSQQHVQLTASLRLQNAINVVRRSSKDRAPQPHRLGRKTPSSHPQPTHLLETDVKEDDGYGTYGLFKVTPA